MPTSEVFTQAELDYLAAQPLGRLATVSPAGQVQNSPVNFFLDAGTIVIGGHGLGASKKFRNVQAGSPVSFVVDDVATVDPWSPRGIEVRGTAVALTDHEPPVPFFSREIIRIAPVKVISWYVDGPRSSRAVRGETSQERGYTDLRGWLLSKLADGAQAGS